MTRALSRRGFLGGLLATGAAGVRASALAGKTLDPQLTALLADTHIAGRPERFPTRHQYAFLERVVAEILALPVRPARFAVLGDIARRHGGADDYAMFLRAVRPLFDAGMEMALTPGNHDNRAPMAAAFPRQAGASRVAGRFVTVTDLGGVDLVLLDTLDDRPQADGTNRVGAALDDAQQAWLRRELPQWPRPFFLGGHHPLAELRFTDGERVSRFVAALPGCIGYLNGHRHVWGADFAIVDYTRTRVLRTLGLGSTHLMDIGWAECRVRDDRVVVRYHAVDFVFPGVQPLDRRDPMWTARVKEIDGADCTFFLPA